ncbi:MAG TPA: SBBP repeat-containing protein [Ignavibacteria bacterium]|nr:SBBP repeat-containing protein [Ignavibacteria bacterium]
MKKIIFVIVIMFSLPMVSPDILSQPAIEWIARYNSLLDSTDVAVDIKTDISGNTYVTGYSYTILGLLKAAVTISYDPNGNQRWRSEYNQLFDDEATALVLDNDQQYLYVAGSSNGLLGILPSDFLILKYRASDGMQMWARTYSQSLLGDDKAIALVVDSHNNPVITGISQGFLLLLTPYDYATVKFDENGNQLWVRRYNGPGNGEDKPTDIAVDSQDNIIVTGGSAGSTSGEDFATLKYNSSGSEVWVQRYDGPGNNEDRAYAIVVDNSDNIAVTGSSTGSGSGLDYATMKYSSSGSQMWLQRYNGPGNNEDRAYAIVVDNSDNIIITGFSRLGATPESEDYTTIKYNNVGIQQWVNRYNGTGSNQDRAYAIVVDNSDNILVTGSSRSSGAAGTEDYATLKYSNSGTQLWVTRYNGTGNNDDRAYAIVVDNSDNIYVTGTSRNSSLLGSEDYLSIKYSESELVTLPPGEVRVPSESALFQNFPNPFNPVTSISFDLVSDSRILLRIFDTQGKEIFTAINDFRSAGRYSYRWDAGDLPSGVYFYKLDAISTYESQNRVYSETKKLMLLK